MASEDDSSEPTELSAFADGDTTGAEAEQTDAEDGTDSTASTESVGDAIATEIAPADGDRPRAETVALGVELLAHLGDDELALPEAMDRIETITTDPTVTRDILDTAETRGIIERDGATIRTRTGGVEIEFEQQVVRRKGDYDCKRCGKGLSTGHFVQFETGEVGPFGSSCIQKVTGTE